MAKAARSTEESSHHLTIDANKFLYSLVKFSKTKISANEVIELFFSSLIEKPEVQKTLGKKRPLKDNGHEKSQKAKGNWHCRKCNSSFTQLSNLKRHLNNKNIHPDVKKRKPSERLSCGDCRQTYSNKGNLKRHLRHCHGKDSNYVSWEAEEGQNVTCTKSLLHSRSDPNQANLSGAERLPCGLCDKTYRRKSHLEWHLEVWHDVNSPFDWQSGEDYEHSESEVDQKVTERVGGKDTLNTHVNRYATENNDNDYNDKSMDGENQNMERDELKHFRSGLNQTATRPGGDKRFPCRKCGETYKNRDTLEAHVMSYHTSNKEYVPGDLTSSDENEQYFVTALNQKTPNPGGKRFPCGKCGKSYQNRTSLKIHVNRYHASEDAESESDSDYSNEGFF